MHTERRPHINRHSHTYLHLTTRDTKGQQQSASCFAQYLVIGIGQCAIQYTSGSSPQSSEQELLMDVSCSFSDRAAMRIRCLLFYALLCTGLLCYFCPLTSAQNHSVLNLGALVAFDSSIGRVAKEAIELAVADINRNKSLLTNSTLVLHMVDSNCSAFQGAAEAMELLKKEVVAVIGPQSTAVAHFVAHMGGATQVPFVSFAATDPALSEFQYPFLFRIAHSDLTQMQAIASFIGYYGWREVVALYMDDDYGTDGAAALSDALVGVGSRLVQKVALVPDVDNTVIGSILTDLAATQTRIFVVHMPQNLAFVLFSEAKNLGMMSMGYAWIVSDSLAGVLGSSDVTANVSDTLQGVIGTRGYYQPHSTQLQAFFSEWKSRSLNTNQLHLYGLFAYDAVWFTAYALDSSLRKGMNISFINASYPRSDAGSTSELAQLRVFKGGQLLRAHMLQTAFQGTSGFIRVSSKGDLIRSAFEIVNVIGGQLRVIGYWTNKTQLSLSPPVSAGDTGSDSLVSIDSPGSAFQVVWPGNTTEMPRGWVLPKNGRPLTIAVPNKTGFKQFASWSANSSNSFRGFCIDVFEGALKYLPYIVPYTFVAYGQNNTTPDYDEMVDQLANKVYDAVVGDVTITTKRMEKVDFSQPYIESGLVVLVPLKSSHSNYAWAFLRPFTATMWFTTLAFFLFTGMVVWMLEHKKNRHFRGHPKKQVVTILWFTFSTLFFSQREKTISTCGRFVVIIWLFVVLIITSSYTANLTSILTVQQLTPTIQGITSLQASNVPVGYQTGSFVKNYLIDLNIANERLKPLSSMDEYERALNAGPDRGGVAAVVDEVPYVQVFLGTHCGFTIAGQEFTKGGWGFAFPKDSELAIDMSTAILTMSENGELQRKHDYWLMTSQCDSSSSKVDSNRLGLDSFWGLFLVTGVVSIGSLVAYMVRLLWLFSREGPRIDRTRSLSSRSTEFVRAFASYVAKSMNGEEGTAQKESVKTKSAESMDKQKTGDSLPKQ